MIIIICVAEGEKVQQEQHRCIREASKNNINNDDSSWSTVLAAYTQDPSIISTYYDMRYKKYTPEVMEEAVKRVVSGETLNRVASEMNLPRSSLQRYVNRALGKPVTW